MKRILSKCLNWIGNLLSHRQRRFVLDRLGVGRIVSWLAKNEYDEVVLSNGITITINPLLHGHMASDGELVYEDDVFEVIEKNLRPGDVFYDIGANVGVFAFSAATLVGDGGAVLAFEPEENNLDCFRRSQERARLGNLTLYDCALGVADGDMSFDRRGGAFSGRLVDAGGDGVGATVRVKVRSIDSLVEAGAPPPTLLKIDVEGGEGAVLEGAERTLRAHGTKVLCEMHAFNPDGVRRAVDLLVKSGYVFHALDGARIATGQDGGDVPRHVLAMPG